MTPTPYRVNFEPASSILSTHRLDLPPADPTLLLPYNAEALVDGEWMVINSDNKVVRAADVTTVGDAATTISFPWWVEKGRTDVQAIQKGTLIVMGQYIFNTRIYDGKSNIGGSGNPAITTMLQPVKVATVQLAGRNYVGLVGSSYNDNSPVVGYVFRLPQSNGGKLRFISGWAVRNGAT